MGRPHLSRSPTLLDNLLHSLRLSLFARTDLSRSLVSSVLFLALFLALLCSPLEGVSLSRRRWMGTALPLTGYGLGTWALMLVLEWEVPTYSHGIRVGRLPGYLLGLVHLFGLSVVGRLGWEGARACLLWGGANCLTPSPSTGGEFAGFVRVSAGACLAVGLGLMHIARKSLRKGAGLPHVAPPLGPPGRTSRFIPRHPSQLELQILQMRRATRPALTPLTLGALESTYGVERGLRRMSSIATLPPYSAPGTPREPPPAYCE